MGWLLVLPVRALLAILQRLPIRVVVRLGRAGGALAWWILGRHRRVALENLTAVFGAEMSPLAIRELARENFRRLGENYVGAVRTAAMTAPELETVLEFTGLENVPALANPPQNIVLACGHFGNFELCARGQPYLPNWRMASTYRALKPPALNRILQELRTRHTKNHLFERTREIRELHQLLSQGGVFLGLLADQHAGVNGLWVPFFGRPCSTSASLVKLAQRYDCPILTILCFRVALGRWRVEIGPPIPTRNSDGSRRKPAMVMQDVNAAYEAAIRRDPANWFWVHRRWKPPTERQLAQASSDTSGSDSAMDD